MKSILFVNFLIILCTLSAHAAEDCNVILSDRVKASIQELAGLRLELDLEAAKGEASLVFRTLEAGFLKKRLEMIAHVPGLSEKRLDQRLQKEVSLLQLGRSAEGIAIEEARTGQSERLHDFDFSTEIIGKLEARRSFHNSILLPNGKVLSVGGHQLFAVNDFKLRSVELFDPDTKKSISIGDMKRARVSARLVLLKNGKVLIAGSSEAGEDTSFELFDPQDNTLTAYESNVDFYKGTVVSVGDQVVVFSEGKGLVFFDVDTRIGEYVDQFFGYPYQRNSMLNDGRIFVSGGKNEDKTSVATIQIIDPAQKTGDVAGSLLSSRVDPTQVVQVDGQVLTLGGRYDDSPTATTSIERFDPATGKSLNVGDLKVARRAHRSVLLSDGRILSVGGIGIDDQRITSVELFDPESGESIELGHLSEMRIDPVLIALPNNEVLVIGGYSDTQTSFNDIERLKVGKQ